MSSSAFVKQATFYFVLKVATSVDDLVWLSPFVAMATSLHEKIRLLITYISLCLFISLTAFFGSWLAVNGLEQLLSPVTGDVDWAERILNIVGAVAIAVFAFFEWKSGQEEDGDDNEDIEEQDIESGLQPAASEDTPLINNQITTSARRRRHVLVDLIVVGICGQLDTLAVFFSALMGQLEDPGLAPLIAGSGLGALLFGCIALSITWIGGPIVKWLQQIPLWALLFAIAIFLLVQGIFG
jgi:fluoride ion exporter CrcB/FEX